MMLAAALCYSLTPLLLVVAGGVEAPFLFKGWYRLDAATGAVGFLAVLYRGQMRSRAVWRSLGLGLRQRDAIFLLTPYFGYTAFAWSARYAGAALPTVIEGLWPLAFIFVTERLVSGTGRWRWLGARKWALAAVCLVGFILVVAGREGGIAWPWPMCGGLAMGLALGLLSALLVSSTAYSFRWAAERKDAGGGRLGDELFWLMTAFVAGSLVSGLANLTAGLAMPAVWSLPANWWLLAASAGAGGVVLDAGGTVLNRSANLAAPDLGVNALNYATPLFALAWFWVFASVVVTRPELLITGAVLIAAANWKLHGSTARTR